MKTTHAGRARILASALWLLAPALAPSPSNGLSCPGGGLSTLGGAGTVELGWTCVSANATVDFATAPVATGGDTIVSTLSFDSVSNQTTSITFTNNGTQTDNFFNLTLVVENVGATAWTGMLITIADLDPNSDSKGTIGTTTHPFAAHLHRSSWNNATSDFQCVSYSGFGCAATPPATVQPGLYNMLLKDKGVLIDPGGDFVLNGSILRLHDKGVDPADATKPMKFVLTLTPIPEPTTALLVVSGLVVLALAGRHASA